MIPHDVALYHLNDLLLDAQALIQAHRDTPTWTLEHAYLYDAITRIERFNAAHLDTQSTPCTAPQLEHIDLLLNDTHTDPQAVLDAYKITDLSLLTYAQADIIITRQINLRLKQRRSAAQEAQP